MKRGEKCYFKKKCLRTPKSARWIRPTCPPKISFGRIILLVLLKVQNLTVFSIIYMIKIRFFGLGDLFQKGFRVAQYLRQFNLHCQCLDFCCTQYALIFEWKLQTVCVSGKQTHLVRCLLDLRLDKNVIDGSGDYMERWTACERRVVT